MRDRRETHIDRRVDCVTMAVGTAAGQIQPASTWSGMFRPSGLPQDPVCRIVGSGCVVDLEQGYFLEGSLVGEMQIDFRIFVAGDCTGASGTYGEHWISYGSYALRVDGMEYGGRLRAAHAR